MIKSLLQKSIRWDQYAKEERKGVDGSWYGPIVIRFAGQPI
jgi:hypothetical protein